MENKIIPSLWFKDNALEAMEFYASIFPDSKITYQAPIAVTAELGGIPFLALNGNSDYATPNSSISFMITCETKEEIDTIWKQLSAEGKVYMKLDSYSWSNYYGWIGDKYGFTWQLYLGKLEDVGNQRIVPTLMFSDSQQGKCEQAVGFYQSVFKDFKSYGVMRYEEGEFKGQVVHTQFALDGFIMAGMDSGVPQDFTFNEAVSFTINCRDQDEIDYFWNEFTKEGQEMPCGWCKDSYGICWQVVPYNTRELIFEAPNAKQAFEAMLKMKKIVIKDLQEA